MNKLIVIKEVGEDNPVAIPLRLIHHVYVEEGQTVLALKESIVSEWRKEDWDETTTLVLTEPFRTFVDRYNDMLEAPEAPAPGDDF